MSKIPPSLIYLVALIGLVLYLWAFWGMTQLATLPEAALPEDLAYPATFEDFPVGSANEIQRLAEGFAPHETVLVESAGRQIQIQLVRRYPKAELATILVSGILFWSVSVFVFAPRIRRPAVVNFFWGTFLFGLSGMIGGIYYPKDPMWVGIGFNMVQLTALAILPPLFVNLSLTFPRRNPILDRIPWLMPVLFSIATLLIAWQGFTYHRYYANPGPDTIRHLEVSHTFAQALMILQVIAAAGILLLRSRRLQLTRELNQLKWILWVFLIGVTPYVFLRQLPELFGFDPPLGTAFDRTMELVIPLMIMFAVARYRFLDIDIIIRRSLIYGILAGIVVGLYMAGAMILSTGPEVRDRALLFLAVGSLVAGVLFFPTRTLIGRLVDRTVFKLRHDYHVVLKELEERLQTASRQQEVASEVELALSRTLNVTRCRVLLEHVEREETEYLPLAEMLAALAPLADAPRTVARPDTTSLPALESSEFPEIIAKQGFVFIEPISCGMEGVGFILLGPKSSGWRFVEPDTNLLREIAEMSGRILERMALIRTVAEESIARARLAEVNRHKNRFLSHVAHDLRTPLASITWSTANLIDGVAGELAPSQVDYLLSVKTSAAHLNVLVQNLLEITQLEEGGEEIDLAPTDLAPIIEQVLITMKPMAMERGIRFLVEINDELTMVMGNSSKIFEIAVNLMDNALKYSPPDTEVEIQVGGQENGHPGFRIRDRGPGFDPAAMKNLYKRYAQGEPSPHAKKHGFGLGLYIVKSYMERMNGEVSARVHPEGGAEFSCVFQKARIPQGESS